jgi:hypothetical protein
MQSEKKDMATRVWRDPSLFIEGSRSFFSRRTSDDTKDQDGSAQSVISRVYSKVNSSIHGMEICAPFLETVLAEANVLLVTAARMSNIKLREDASTASTEYMPMKVSPAAVVSTTLSVLAQTPFAHSCSCSKRLAHQA